MKKIIITSLIASLVSCVSFAQTVKDAGTPRKAESKEQKAAPAPERKQAPKPERSPEVAKERQNSQLEEMDEVVNLNEKQEAEIRKIHEEHNNKMQDIRSKYHDQKDKSGMREEVKVLQEERKTRVHAVLTDDQRAKWKALKKEERSESAE